MNLAEIFHFTPDDLAANTAGELSPAQRLFLKTYRLPQWGVGLFFTVILIVLYLRDGFDSFGSISAGGLFGFIVFGMIYSWIRLEWALRENRVIALEGLPTIKRHRSRLYLVIARYNFPITAEQATALDPNRLYRVYVPPKFPQMLTIEELN